jgi:prophage regulatory protein
MTAEDLMGIHEIAEQLGVSRQRVDELSRRADFPLPVQRLRSGRIWRRKDVESWARDTGRLS